MGGRGFACGLVMSLLVVAPAVAQQLDEAVYVEDYDDPVLTEMEDRDEQLREAAKQKTAEILAAAKAEQEGREDAEQKLRFDLSGVARPESPDDFALRQWHFPPTPQYMTGACWSFATTSLAESEIKRLTGQQIKLSEMWTVYWEFVNKAKGFVAKRGDSLFEHGSQSAALIAVYREHGVVPRDQYEGVLAADGRFDHELMHEQVTAFLTWCRDTNFWDEEVVIAMVRRLLDATMGRPPENVRWDGVDLSPRQFLEQICQLDPDAYVEFMSTLEQPFWEYGEYRVPDNWWHGKTYVNVPLEQWYQALRSALENGFTVSIGGDVSEPGCNGFEDIAVIPSFDIPAEYIDQSARELRFDNGATTDDHGVHMVGLTKIGQRDWYLVKDSNRSSRHGRFEGYFMYRDDYVKLKMLTFMVHRDAVRAILERVGGAAP